jgi:NAD-dependent deacetylase
MSAAVIPEAIAQVQLQLDQIRSTQPRGKKLPDSVWQSAVELARCETCSRRPFDDTNLYEPPAEIPRCECGGRIRPHNCWFGEVPFELDRIYEALDACTLFVAAGTSGVVEPAASFVAQVNSRARTIYVGPEEPENASAFTKCYLGKAGKMLPD